MFCSSGALRPGISGFILHHISSLIPPHLRLVSACSDLKSLVETEECQCVSVCDASARKLLCVGVGRC